MEKQQDDTLMKARSYRGVIATGLRVYTASFRKTFRATWIFSLLFAVVTAAIGVLLTMRMLPVGLQMAALPQFKWLIAREHLPMIIGFVLLVVVQLVVFVLLVRTAGRKLGLFPRLRRAVKAALRHWLLTIGILLAGGIVLIPICLLLGLPVVILTVASTQAQLGTLLGDPLGMPSYLPWLTACIWLLASFLQVYIVLSLLFIGYYAYGSAETQQRERNQQKLSIQ